MSPTTIFRNISLLSVLTFWSCSSDPAVTSTSTPIVAMDLERTLQISTLSLLENSTLIHPELTEKSGIDQIEKVAMSGEKVFLVNRNRRSKNMSLLAFTRAGDFLWERSGHKDGPGRFSGYTDMMIGPDGNLLILDGLKRTLLTYDLNGNYLTSNLLATDAQRLAHFRDGSYATHRNNTYQFGDKVSPYNLNFTNSTGEQTGGSYLFMPEVVRDMKLSGERFFPRRNGNSYFCINPPSDTVYACSPGNVVPLFTLDYPARKTKVDFLARLQQSPEFHNARGAYNLVFLEFLNDPEIFSKYDLVAEENEYYLLSFRKGSSRYFVKVNKENLQSAVYTFDDRLLDRTRIFLLDEKTLALTTDQPYALKQWLATRNPQLHDEWFAKLSEAEPNPMLLLIDLATFNEIGLLAAAKN